MNVEVMSENGLDNKEIFSQFVEELNDFENTLSENSDIENEQIEQVLYRGLSGFLDDVKDKKAFEIILDKLSNKEVKITVEDIDNIRTILLDLEDKDIDQLDLKELKKIIDTELTTKKEAGSLMNKISDKETKELKEAKDKITGYNNKLKSFRVEHPIWTKALISLLPATFAAKFFKESVTSTTGSGFAAQLNKVWEQIQGGLSSIAVGVFSWFAPKEMKTLLSEIKEFEGTLPEDFYTKIGDSEEFREFADTISETLTEDEKNAKEKEEKLRAKVEKYEKNFRKTLPIIVKKTSGKDMSENEIDDIINEIDFYELFKNNSEALDNALAFYTNKEESDGEATYAGLALEQGVVLPSKVFFKVFTVLHKRNYVSFLNLSVEFAKKGGKMAISTLGLVSSGASVLMGETNGEDLSKQLAEIYDKDPKLGNEFMAAMVYRHGGLFLRTLGNIADYSGKGLVYLLSGETNYAKLAKDGLKGEIDEYMKVLKGITKEIPGNAMAKDLRLLETAIEGVERNQKIVTTLKELRIKGITTNAGQEFIDIYNKLHNGSAVKDHINIFANIDNIDDLKPALVEEIAKVGKGLNTKVGEVGAWVGKSLLGGLSEKHVLNSFAKNIETVNDTLANIIKDDTFLGKVKSQFSKLELTKDMMNAQVLKDKVVYKFAGVKELKEFTRNLKIMFRSSPEAVKFLINKSPIFVVAGLGALDWEKDKELSDNMTEIGKTLLEIVPLVGPVLILADSAKLEHTDIAQASIGGALLVTDLGYFTWLQFTNPRPWSTMGKYMVRPIADIGELVGAGFRGGSHVVKFALEGGSLIRKESGLLKSILSEFKSLRFSKKTLAIVSAMLLMYGYHEFFGKEISDDIKEELAGCTKEDGSLDKNLLDEYIKTNWSELETEGKDYFIKTAFAIKTGVDINDLKIETEENSNKYTLIYKGNTVPNYLSMLYIEEEFAQVISIYEKDNIEIEIEFAGYTIENSIKSIVKNIPEEFIGTKEEFIVRHFTNLGYKQKIIDGWIKNHT